MAVSREFKRAWRRLNKKAMIDYCGGRCAICHTTDYDVIGVYILSGQPAGEWPPYVNFAPPYGSSWSGYTKYTLDHEDGSTLCNDCLAAEIAAWKKLYPDYNIHH